MVYVLDTHAVVWFLEGSSRLGAAARVALSDPVADLVIPTIVSGGGWIPVCEETHLGRR